MTKNISSRKFCSVPYSPFSFPIPHSLFPIPHSLFPMTNGNTAQAIESLAAEIGENVYMDIANWHLYLSDAKLHTVLAEQIYPMLSDGVPGEDRVREILQGVLVKLGGSQRQVPLTDLLPMSCQSQLMEILEEFQRKM